MLSRGSGVLARALGVEFGAREGLPVGPGVLPNAARAGPRDARWVARGGFQERLARASWVCRRPARRLRRRPGGPLGALDQRAGGRPDQPPEALEEADVRQSQPRPSQTTSRGSRLTAEHALRGFPERLGLDHQKVGRAVQYAKYYTGQVRFPRITVVGSRFPRMSLLGYSVKKPRNRLSH